MDATNYHDQVDINNELKLRELRMKLPRFCGEFFRGIEPTTSSRTRIAYGYDLVVFFNYMHEYIVLCDGWTKCFIRIL